MFKEDIPTPTAVTIGDVPVKSKINDDKQLRTEVLQAAANVYASWQNWKPKDEPFLTAGRTWALCPEYRNLINNCADLLQTTCELLASLHVDDIACVMQQRREFHNYEKED